jgi:hypothetical protein
LLAYYKTIWRTAATDAKAFWSGHRIMVFLTGPLIGLLASSALKKGVHGWDSWDDIMHTVLISVLCFLATIVLTFIVSLIRSPKILDDERQNVISTRDAQIVKQDSTIEQLKSALANPKKTPAELHCYNLARAALTRHGESAKGALRLMLQQEMITADWHQTRPTIPEIAAPTEARKVLSPLAEDGLITMQERYVPDSGSEQVWGIVPTMRSALEELLYPESNSDSSQHDR